MSSNGWRKQGGLSNFLAQNSISVNSLSCDVFTLRRAYFGTFDICGEFHVSGNALVDNDVRTNNVSVIHNVDCENLTVRNDTQNLGNMSVTKNFTVSTGNIYVVNGNVDLSQNLFLRKTLYLGNSGSAFLFGTDTVGNIGINTASPVAALDVRSASQSFLLNVSSQQPTAYTVLSRTNANHCSVIYSDPSSARIDMFVDTAFTTLSSLPDCRIQYSSGGNLVIDVSNNTDILSNVVISPDATRTVHKYGETLMVYASSASSSLYQPYFYETAPGNIRRAEAITAVASVNNGLSFLNLVNQGDNVASNTGNTFGLSMGGGLYPWDTARTMGTLGLIRPSTTQSLQYIPAINVVTGNSSIVSAKSTVSINNVRPETDAYSLDVNGPVHIKNGDVTMTYDAYNAEITMVAVSPSNPQYAVAIGSPVSLYSVATPKRNQQIYYTTNGGNKWNTNLAGSANGVDDTFLETSSSFLPIRAAYVVDASLSFFAGKNNLYYSNTSGATWKVITLGSFLFNPEITSLYVYKTGAQTGHVYFTAQNAPTIIVSFAFNASLYSSTTGIDVSTQLIANYTIPYYLINPQFTISGSLSSTTTIFLTGYVTSSSTNYIYRIDNLGVSADSLSISLVTSIVSSARITDIAAYETNNIIVAVFDNGTIRSSLNGWTNNIVTSADILYGVTLFNNGTCAIVVGKNGSILYSVNTSLFAVWTSIPYAVLNSGGNADSLLNPAYDLTSISRAIDVPTCQFYVVQRRAAYVDGISLGESRIYHLYLPNLFSNSTNYVLDVSGTQRVSGDIQLNDGGRITTANNSTVYLFNDAPVSSIYFGDSASAITVGNSGNVNAYTYIQSKLYVLKDTTFQSNMFITGNVRVTTPSNGFMGAVFDNNVTSTGDILIGGLPNSLLGLPVTRDPSSNAINTQRNIRIGNFTGSGDLSNNIYLGGPLDIVVLGGTVVSSTSYKIGPAIYVNFASLTNSSANTGLFFGETGNTSAGRFTISANGEGFLMRSTKSTNTVLMDTNALTYTGAGALNNAIVTLSKEVSGNTEMQHRLSTSTLDVSSVLVRNYALTAAADASYNAQIVDTGMRILGNVGIGTASSGVLTSGYALDVSGNVNVNGNIVALTGLQVATANDARQVIGSATFTTINGAQYVVDASTMNLFGKDNANCNARFTSHIYYMPSINVMQIERSFPTAGYYGITMTLGLYYMSYGNTVTISVKFNNTSAFIPLVVLSDGPYNNTVSAHTYLSGGLTNLSNAYVFSVTGLSGGDQLMIYNIGVSFWYSASDPSVTKPTTIHGPQTNASILNLTGGLQALSTQLIHFGNNSPIMDGSNLKYNSIPISAIYNYSIIPVTTQTNLFQQQTNFIGGVVVNGYGNTTAGYVMDVSGNVIVSDMMRLGKGLAINKTGTTFGYALDILGNVQVTGNMMVSNGLSVSNGLIVSNGFTVQAGTTVTFPGNSIAVAAINGLATALTGFNSTGNVAINKSTATTNFQLDVSGNAMANHTVSSVSASIGKSTDFATKGYALDVSGYILVNKISPLTLIMDNNSPTFNYQSQGFALTGTSTMVNDVVGGRGYVFSFNGSSNYYLTVSPIRKIMTISFWVYYTGQTSQVIFNSKWFPIYFNSEGRLFAYIYFTGNGPILSESFTKTTNTWNHYAVTISATSAILYVNGVADYTDSSSMQGISSGSNGWNRVDPSNTPYENNGFYVGGTGPNVGTTSPEGSANFVGRLDNIFVHNYALSAAEVAVIALPTGNAISSMDVSGGISITSGGLHVVPTQTINFGTNAPKMSGANISAGSIPIAALAGSVSTAGINSLGNVAINTTNLATNNIQLDVIGNLRVTGTLSLSNGSIADSALSGNVVMLANTQIISGSKTFSSRLTVQSGTVSLDSSNSIVLATGNIYNGVGGYNVCIGFSAMSSVSLTGAALYNTSIGGYSLLALTSGDKNVAVGAGAGKAITTGQFNTAIGVDSLIFTVSGQYNVAVGYFSGQNSTGSNNTFLGANTWGGAFSNSTAIGTGATINASNQIVLGTAAQTVVIPGTISGTNTFTGTTNLNGSVTVASTLTAPVLIGSATFIALSGTAAAGDGNAFGLDRVRVSFTGFSSVGLNLLSLPATNPSAGYYTIVISYSGLVATDVGVIKVQYNNTGDFNAIGAIVTNTGTTIVQSSVPNLTSGITDAANAFKIGFSTTAAYSFKSMVVSVYYTATNPDTSPVLSTKHFRTNINSTLIPSRGLYATAEQVISFGDNAPIMSGANIMSGTVPIAALAGSVSTTGINSTGNVAINQLNSAITPNYHFDVSGNARISGDTAIIGNISAASFTSSSDRRLKENIVPLVSASKTIANICPVFFDWKETGKRDCGFIAQNVFAELPYMNPLFADWGVDAHDPITGESTFYKLDYGKMTPHLWAAAQELYRENTQLKADMREMEATIREMEERFESRLSRIESVMRMRSIPL